MALRGTVEAAGHHRQLLGQSGPLPVMAEGAGASAALQARIDTLIAVSSRVNRDGTQRPHSAGWRRWVRHWPGVLSMRAARAPPQGPGVTQASGAAMRALGRWRARELAARRRRAARPCWRGRQPLNIRHQRHGGGLVPLAAIGRSGRCTARARPPTAMPRRPTDSPRPMQTHAWIEHQLEDETPVLCLSGAWRLPNVPAIAQALRALPLRAGQGVVVDGSRLEAIDTAAGFLLLHHLAALGCTQAMVSARGFDARHGRLLALVKERMAAPPAAGHSAHRGLVHGVGAATLRLSGLLKTHVAFIGRVAAETFDLVRNPRLLRPRETVSQFEAVCLDAIPIVALVNFLIGVVVAYLLGVQAQRYGANLFVADGVGLAVCRELSPLLASVLVAGRSGAAFTAQIGTMKVEEEIDAISTLGLSPIQVLVIPRLLALMIALPLLVFVGDVAGVAGGMVVGAWQLDITPAVFADRLHGVLEMRHFLIGIGKAPVFAAVIAIIGCRMGMLAARDARSVGQNTTSTVVQSIVWVIVLDAVFAIVFQHLEI